MSGSCQVNVKFKVILFQIKVRFSSGLRQVWAFLCQVYVRFRSGLCQVWSGLVRLIAVRRPNVY